MGKAALDFEEATIDGRIIAMVEVAHEDEELPHAHGLRLAAGVHPFCVVEDGPGQHSDDQRECLIERNHNYNINHDSNTEICFRKTSSLYSQFRIRESSFRLIGRKSRTRWARQSCK